MDTFSALAEPTRRNIIELLAQRGQLTVNGITAHFEISTPAISQHLKVLKQAQLVTVEKQAQQRLYAINPHKLTEVEYWIQQITTSWEKRFKKLDTLLEEKMHEQRQGNQRSK